MLTYFSAADQRLTHGILAGALNDHIRMSLSTFYSPYLLKLWSIGDSKQLQTLLQQFTSSISRVESDLRFVRDGLEGNELANLACDIAKLLTVNSYCRCRAIENPTVDIECGIRQASPECDGRSCGRHR